jgi:alpha-D-xyloside xylohydrolase
MVPQRRLAPFVLLAAATLAPALSALATSSCGDPPIVLAAPAFTLGDGRFRLDVTGDGSALAFLRDSTTVLSLDARSFQIGIAVESANNAAAFNDRSWDPWELDRRGDAESGVAFRTAISSRATMTQAGREAEVNLDFGDGLRAKVAIALASPARFTLTFVQEAPPGNAPLVVLARIRVRTSGDPNEGFYGLGEQVDSVNSRGKIRAMQIEADGDVESTNNEAHVPVPLLIGTRGWGMFVASARVGTFDVVRKDPSIVEATFAVAALKTEPRAEALRVDLFAGNEPLDLYREYYAASGQPRPPPPWALGPWIWRNESKDQAEVEDDIAKIRSLDLATSGIWIDRPYARAVNTFDFDPPRFPDPQRMIDRAHAAGLRIALWSTPYLESAAEPMVSEAKAKGFFPKETGIPINDWSVPIDFTSPDAAAFWRRLIQNYTSLGIDGFKLDYGEDLVPSLAGKRNVWRFSDGSDERTMHHRFSGLYHRVYVDAATGRDPSAPPIPNAGVPFLLVRSAHWGEQGLGVIVWPGDMDATFTKHKEEFPARNGTPVKGVGGLPATVIMGLSLAASGFPYFAADTGGYRHSPPDKELFIRWAQQTALSTVMEVGDASSQPPWLFNAENGRDEEALAIYRTYARLHMRLFPYEWTHALRIADTGRPIQRPLGLAHPELNQHPDDEYMFGDDLLVAPVLARGQTKRRLLVPRGTWIDFWDATPFTADAKGEIEVDAPLAKLPLFIREGAIIPMLRPTIDTLAMSTDDGIESFARDAGPLWALIAPGPPRAFDLWDGARIARLNGDSFEVRDGVAFDRGFVLEILATSEPVQISRDEGLVPHLASRDLLTSATSGWTWTKERRGTLFIKLPPGNAKIIVR